MAINAGSTDDLILLPWDHETTTETGAYFSPAMLGPTILSTTCAPVQDVLNRNSAIDVDGYYCHGESQTSSGFWSEIMTGPLDDLIVGPWNHQTEMLSSSSTPTSATSDENLNSNNIDSSSGLDDYQQHRESEPSSGFGSEINTGLLDDPVMLLWNHQITMETGAYLCPTIWPPTCAPTSAAIMFNNNRFGGSGERDDHHQRHQEPASSTTWSTIVTEPPDVPIMDHHTAMEIGRAISNPFIKQQEENHQAGSTTSSWQATANERAMLQYLAHQLLSEDDMFPELQEHPTSSDIGWIEGDQAAPGLSTSNSVDHHLSLH